VVQYHAVQVGLVLDKHGWFNPIPSLHLHPLSGSLLTGVHASRIAGMNLKIKKTRVTTMNKIGKQMTTRLMMK